MEKVFLNGNKKDFRIWDWALGTVGTLLVIPLTILLKITFDGREETTYFSLILGDETSLERYEK